MENIEEIEADLKSLVLDSRFDLTDDRLITQYLRKKIANQYVPPCLIADVNIYQDHPNQLPESYSDLRLWLVDEWYFFSPRNLNELRAAGNGYWKVTGADKPVNNVNDEIVGFKQELVFIEGKGEKTNWIMHEYKDVENRQRSSKVDDMMLDDWVLCRIYYDNEEDDGVWFNPNDIVLNEPGFICPLDERLLGSDYPFCNGIFDDYVMHKCPFFNQEFLLPDSSVVLEFAEALNSSMTN